MIHKFHLKQVSLWEESLCLRFNRVSQYRTMRSGFRFISRLGDGIFWYGLMLFLVYWYGKSAWIPVLHMVLAGLTCTLIYKWVKVKTSRPRPYEVIQEIVLGTNPLDPFSFPSGHTLHAVAFTIVLLGYYPAMDWLVVPFTAMVALSRVVLGLHYPSDVLAGALIGTVVAAASFWAF